MHLFIIGFAERSFIELFLYSIQFSSTNSFLSLCFLDVCWAEDAALQLSGWWRFPDLVIRTRAYKYKLLPGLFQITILSSSHQRFSLCVSFLCIVNILECRGIPLGTSRFWGRIRNDQENLSETALNAYPTCSFYIYYTYPRNDLHAVCYSDYWGTLVTCRYQPRIYPSC
jgi:hypothetical protein